MLIVEEKVFDGIQQKLVIKIQWKRVGRNIFELKKGYIKKFLRVNIILYETILTAFPLKQGCPPSPLLLNIALVAFLASE